MRLRSSRRDEKPRSRSSLPALLFAMLMVVSLNGCTSHKRDGGLVSASMSISSYAMARQRASASKESMSYYFPVLEIYNGAGILVYSSHESRANAQALKDFPDSVQKLQPQEQAPRLRNILEEIPAFKTNVEEIAQRKRWVIISTDLEHCASCVVQDNALRETKERLAQQQIADILEIYVSQP